eukprot:c18825_g1_i1 orf=223-963(+)
MAVATLATLFLVPCAFSLPISSSRCSLRLLKFSFSLPGKILGRHDRSQSSFCFANSVVKAELKSVDGEEAKRLVEREGFTVVDIRDGSQYAKAHIIHSVHIPLFIENNDGDIGTIIRRTLHNNFSGLFFGLAFTKLNPEFVNSFEKKFSKDSKLLLVCQEGLRSLTAAEKLKDAGYQNLAYIISGLQKVKPGIFGKEGPRELEDAGKGGLVTIQGKISAVLGTVLVAAYLFLTLFPNQAEQLFFSK